jgi:hypothetical protein
MPTTDIRDKKPRTEAWYHTLASPTLTAKTSISCDELGELEGGTKAKYLSIITNTNKNIKRERKA